MNKIITCLNNRVVKIILSLTLLVMMVCTIPKISDVNAQSGEGVDVCTWYSANGFKSYAQYKKWLEFKQKPYNKANQKKIMKCATKAGITVGVSAITDLLVVNPAKAVKDFGTTFIVCMFGY